MSKKRTHMLALVPDVEGTYEMKMVPIINRNKFKVDFSRVTKEGSMILAQSNLTATEYKVMVLLIGYMDFNNIAVVNQKFLADTLKIAQPNISRTVNKLLRKSFIFKEEINGVSCFRVNACIAWKGDADVNYMEIADEDARKLAPIG